MAKELNMMNKMIKQAQALQDKMARLQAELETKEYEGAAGGGMVKAIVNGSQQLVSVSIDPEVVNPEDIELLEDLIVAAVNQARETAQEDVGEKMKELTGGLSIPGMGIGL